MRNLLLLSTAAAAVGSALIVAHDGIHLQEIGETGSVTGTPLMDLAQQIADGETTEAEAVAKSRILITEATTPR
ncbi:hypothetical protein [Brevundimonas sp. TWP1-2-1b1]|uniref:hypothetical protein n=1 Tax=unclassified Brevundimonas TaxID=2622653 RepID=UPI003CF88F98